MKIPLATPSGFPLRVPSDRTFFLVYLLIIWAAMLGGFGLDMIAKAAKGKLDYPLVVHAHALVFGGWLILLTAQILLIRRGDYRLHRRLGIAATILIPLMLVLGPVTAITMYRVKLGSLGPGLPPAFMSTQFTNVFGSSVLLIAGLLMRRDSSAHKRLMLMGTLAITEPGFSRIWAGALYGMLGDGFWQYIAETYVGTIVAMLGVGVYDYATRKRLHPAYVAALLWVLANEALAAWLFYQPGWIALTTDWARP